MSGNFRVASTRINRELLEQYDKILAAEAVTRHTDLKRYIEDRVTGAKEITQTVRANQITDDLSEPVKKVPVIDDLEWLWSDNKESNTKKTSWFW